MRWVEWLFLVLGGALFALLLRRFGVSALVECLSGQGSRFFLILIPTLISYLLFCAAWWLVLDPASRREISFGYLFLVSVAGFSINYITPIIALGGEPLKVVLLSRRLGRHRAISSVIAYNALHVLSHLIVFIATCAIGFGIMELSPGRAGMLVAGGLVAAGLAAVILTAHERGVVEHVLRPIGRLRFLRIPPESLAAWRERLGRYDESVTSFYRTRRRAFWTALAADFLGRSIWAMEVLVMLANVGRWCAPVRAFFVYSFASMLMVLTFFVPYELGVKEGTFYLCLKWLHLDPSLGVYLGVASRVREIVWIAIGLGIMLALGVRRLPVARREAPVRKGAE